MYSRFVSLGAVNSLDHIHALKKKKIFSWYLKLTVKLITRKEEEEGRRVLHRTIFTNGLLLFFYFKPYRVCTTKTHKNIREKMYVANEQNCKVAPIIMEVVSCQLLENVQLSLHLDFEEKFL